MGLVYYIALIPNYDTIELLKTYKYKKTQMAR